MVNRNFIFSLIFFLLAGCSWGPSIFHSKSASNELISGINYFQQLNYIKAKAVFLHLVETRIGSPEIEEAQWYLALISEKLDKPNIAKQKFKVFLKNYPSSNHKKEAEAKIASFNKKPLSIPIDQAAPKEEIGGRAEEGGEFAASASLPAAGSDEIAAGIQSYQDANYIKARSVFLIFIENHKDSPEIEEARWYLALISEKLDKPDIAGQRFKDFIKNYPLSLHRKEAEEKIAGIERPGLPPPDLKGKESAETKASQTRRSQPRTGPDKVSGSFITEYLYDEMFTPSPATNTQSRLSEFFDFRWRKGSGSDLRLNFSGMNAKDFLVSSNDRTRLTKFYLEGNNTGWFSNFRLGRQPSSGSTLFNRFDGLSFSLPFAPVIWTNNVGVPVDIFANDTLHIESDRKFYETYLSVIDYYHISGKVYFTQEYFQDFSTRKAVGLNGFWMYDTLNITTLLDRDIDFNKFNDGMVSFDYTRATFHYSGMVEYRRNPFLDYGNALADPSLVTQIPPITSLDILQQTLTRDQIMQLALNNSQTSLDYSLGLGVELSSIWRADLRYGKTFYNPEDLAGRLFTFPAVNSQQVIDRYSLFILERNFFNINEIFSTLFLYQPGSQSTNTSIMASFLKIWNNGLQGGPRFRYENTVFSLIGNASSGGSSLIRVVPGFVIRYTLKNGMEASLEGDDILENNSLSPGQTNTLQTRTAVSIPF